MPREEVDDGSLLACQHELSLESRLQGLDAMFALCRLPSIRRFFPVRFRSGLCHEYERAQANESGFQNLYLLIGDRGAAHAQGRSCRSCGARYPKCYEREQLANSSRRKVVTNVNV
jgi:hypothetical protein